MGILSTFLSKKLLVVLVPLVWGIVRGAVCGSTAVLDRSIIELAWGFMAADVVQTVAVAWINRPRG